MWNHAFWAQPMWIGTFWHPAEEGAAPALALLIHGKYWFRDFDDVYAYPKGYGD